MSVRPSIIASLTCLAASSSMIKIKVSLFFESNTKLRKFGKNTGTDTSTTLFVDRFENPLSSQFSGKRKQCDHATSRPKCRNFFRVATNCLVRKEVRTCQIEEIVLCTTLHTKQKTDLCAISRSIAMSMIFKEKKLQNEFKA